MHNPIWFGRRYPSVADLEEFAMTMRTLVVRDPIIPAAYIGQVPHPGYSVILIPQGLDNLDECWQLAHELGHLVLHPGGYISEWTYRKQEAQATRWAAQALIPEAAVRRHRNACQDAFIAALSAHFGDIPLRDCPQRRLAAEIAAVRLRVMEEVA